MGDWISLIVLGGIALLIVVIALIDIILSHREKARKKKALAEISQIGETIPEEAREQPVLFERAREELSKDVDVYWTKFRNECFQDLDKILERGRKN